MMPVAAAFPYPLDGEGADRRIIGEELCHIDFERASDLQRRRDGRHALATLTLDR